VTFVPQINGSFPPENWIENMNHFLDFSHPFTCMRIPYGEITCIYEKAYMKVVSCVSDP